jgi:hypothetical protein
MTDRGDEGRKEEEDLESERAGCKLHKYGYLSAIKFS